MKPMATTISLVQKGHSSTPDKQRHADVNGPSGLGDGAWWALQRCAYRMKNSTSEEKFSINRLQSRAVGISLYDLRTNHSYTILIALHIVHIKL